MQRQDSSLLAAALEAIGPRWRPYESYGFQIEMKYSAWRLGLKLREIPIVFTERREGNSENVGTLFGEALFGVLRLPFRKIRASRKNRSIGQMTQR